MTRTVRYRTVAVFGTFVGLVVVFCSDGVPLWNRFAIGKALWNEPPENLRIQGADLTRWKQVGNACTPRGNIMFLKMHKCASSTVQNVLFRYGEKHNLNFVLPHKGWHIKGPPYLDFIEVPTDEYNIWCQHSKFDEEEIADIMPDDTVYVTVLREPISMYESIFTYLKLDDQFHISGPNTLGQFLDNPYMYYNKTKPGRAKNPMLNDLGLELKFRDDQKRIDAMIGRLANKFDLVMMTEYFHESLILFKDLMCWSMEDVVYFTLNARSKSSVFSAITPDMRTKIQKWNMGDVKLYHHFNQTFWKKVNEFGEDRMRKEVEHLVTLNKNFYDRCVGDVVQNKEGVWHPVGIDVVSLELKPGAKNDPECVAMATSEPEYTSRIREKMIRRYHIE